MEEKSRSKITLEKLCKIPYILNIRWSKDYQVFVDIIEETPEAMEEYIRNLLLKICDKYEVVFQIVKRKNWWQRFLDKFK